MKKFGFTLAEVLITLTIIGVVAMMTLPALMTNVQEQQAVTGLKKGINTLTEAGQMNAAVNGFDYSQCTVTTANSASQSLTNLILDRLQIDNTATGLTTATADGVTTYTIAAGANYANRVLGAANAAWTVIFLRDGSAIAYQTANALATQNNGGAYNVYYDINGAKGPNLLSTCAPAQVNEHVTNGETRTANACDTPGNRLIRDQFELQVSGGNARPLQNSIAEWILNNR